MLIQNDDDENSLATRARRDHMANERTFLAWIRTSIGIMAFGFVIEKFALFLKQVAFILEKSSLAQVNYTPSPLQGYSSIFGVFVVGLGALMGFLAFIKYKNVERQINENIYQPSLILDILLTISVISIGIFLVIYLSGL